MSRLSRVLSVYHLVRNCEEVSFEELWQQRGAAERTFLRDIRLLERAGVLAARYERKYRAFYPVSLEFRPMAEETNQTRRRYLEKLRRLCLLMGRMAENGKSLYLLGARPGVAEKAARKLEGQYPGLRIAGTHDGYFQEDAPVVRAIRDSGADVVFVCLGAPKQEKWMKKNGEATGARLLVGLGGCLDVFSGEVRRAPEAFQKLGLEWLYRLAKEPSRLGRMIKLPLFLVHAAGEKGKKA